MEEGAVFSEVLQRESLECFFIVNLTGSKLLQETPLGVSLRVFPQRLNCGQMTQPECEWHHPMGWGPRLNKEEKAS